MPPRVIIDATMTLDDANEKTMQLIDAARLTLARDVDHLLDRLAPLADRIDRAEGNETTAAMLRDCRGAVARFVQESAQDFDVPREATVAVVCDALTPGVRIEFSHPARAWTMTRRQARTVAEAIQATVLLLDQAVESPDGVQ